MSELKNKFSWSKSRDALFNECKRKYYYNHYGFWNGWDSRSPEKARQIYILKQLMSKEIWIGQVVHDIIKNILSQLKIGNEISLNYALNLLKKRLEKDFNESKSKLYQRFPKKSAALFEHEYDSLISKDEWDELFRKAEKCIINFYNSDTYRKIKNTPRENWLFLEDFLSFDFEGTELFLSIDFAIKEGNKIILYDWKTGRERDVETEIQLTCYALFVSNRWNIAPENIVARIYNLSIDKEDEFGIDTEKIDNIKEHIRDSILNMKSHLSDGENNIAEEKDFPKEEGPLCSWCNFKKICMLENISN